MGAAGIGTILIIAVIILIIIVYNMITKSKKKKNILNILTKQATENGCKISEFDYDNNFVIGIDKESHFLFFFSFKDNFKTAIKLTEIKKSKVNHVTRTIGSGKNLQTTTDRVELVLAPIAIKNSDTILECYNSNNHTQLVNELVIAEKWASLINGHINKIILKSN